MITNLFHPAVLCLYFPEMKKGGNGYEEIPPHPHPSEHESQSPTPALLLGEAGTLPKGHLPQSPPAPRRTHTLFPLSTRRPWTFIRS